MIEKTKNVLMKSKGYTLIELLVVLLIFSILSVVVVQSLALSLRGSRKSESIGQVRENVEYAANIMDRLLRNAQDIVSCTSTQIVYRDEFNTTPNPQFNCLGGANGYIASGSGSLRLTSTTVYIDCATSPVFTCPAATPGVPESIDIRLIGRDVDSFGAEGATVTSTSKILLRTY